MVAIRMQGGKCKICNRPIDTTSDAVAHHIVPISEGGKTAVKNCEVLCRTCSIGRVERNSEKK